MKTITIKKENVKTQSDAILWHLKEHGEITSWEAIKEYGATRLSGIIFVLRKNGYDIQSLPYPVKTRFGRNTTIAKYVYTAPPKTLFKQLGMYCEIDK